MNCSGTQTPHIPLFGAICIVAFIHTHHILHHTWFNSGLGYIEQTTMKRKTNKSKWYASLICHLIGMQLCRRYRTFFSLNKKKQTTQTSKMHTNSRSAFFILVDSAHELEPDWNESDPIVLWYRPISTRCGYKKSLRFFLGWMKHTHTHTSYRCMVHNHYIRMPNGTIL